MLAFDVYYGYLLKVVVNCQLYWRMLRNVLPQVVSDSWHPPLRALIQFLAHVFEQLRLRLGRVLADLTRLRHPERRNAMRRVIAFVIHPGDDLATVRVLGVT